MVEYIFSQILAFIALIMYVLAFQSKSKNRLLAYFVTANLLMAIGFVLLQSWIAVSLFSIAALRMLAFFVLEKKKPKQWVSTATLIVFITANIVATYFTATWWYDYFLLVGACAFTFGAWKKGEHIVRLTNVFHATLLIVHNALIANWMGIATMSACIISVAIYYVRKYGKKSTVTDISSDDGHEEITIHV